MESGIYEPFLGLIAGLLARCMQTLYSGSVVFIIWSDWWFVGSPDCWSVVWEHCRFVVLYYRMICEGLVVLPDCYPIEESCRVVELCYYRMVRGRVVYDRFAAILDCRIAAFLDCRIAAWAMRVPYALSVRKYNTTKTICETGNCYQVFTCYTKNRIPTNLQIVGRIRYLGLFWFWY